jgi:ABC-type molybdate transport system permease subunit
MAHGRDGTVALELKAGGAVRLPSGGVDYRVGEDVRFVVRPEKLDLRGRDLSAHGVPSLPVTVEDRVYQGVSTMWIVRDGADERFVVYEQNEKPFEEASRFTVGGRAFLCWNAKHAVMIRGGASEWTPAGTDARPPPTARPAGVKLSASSSSCPWRSSSHQLRAHLWRSEADRGLGRTSPREVLANYAGRFPSTCRFPAIDLDGGDDGLCLVSYPIVLHRVWRLPPQPPWPVVPSGRVSDPTYAWMFLLRTEGLINRTLLSAGLISHPLELLYNNFAVLIGLLYGEIPFMILPLYASLEKLDLSLLEASADLGASRASTFRRVTVPLTMPGIVAGIILVFVPSLGQFIVSDLLGGARTILAGNLIQNQFAVARNKPFGSAVAFELTAAVLALLFAYTHYTRKKGQDVLL